MAEPRDITNPSRRATLGALAAALGGGALALSADRANCAAADPIFAAIERHKAVFDRFHLASIATDEVAAEQQGREVAQADWDALDVASAEETEALDALVGTSPTSLRGLRAVIDYLVTFDRYCLPEASGRFLATLKQSPLLAA